MSIKGNTNTANNKNYVVWHMERGCVYNNLTFPPVGTDCDDKGYCIKKVDNLYNKQTSSRRGALWTFFKIIHQ